MYSRIENCLSTFAHWTGWAKLLSPTQNQHYLSVKSHAAPRMALLLKLALTLHLAVLSSSKAPWLTSRPVEILDLRCSLPWHVALYEQWSGVDSFEILFSAGGTQNNVSLSKVARKMLTPVRGETLHPMAKTMGLVVSEDLFDPRPPYLTILMPVTQSSMGTYHCVVEYSKESSVDVRKLTFSLDIGKDFVHLNETFGAESAQEQQPLGSKTAGSISAGKTLKQRSADGQTEVEEQLPFDSKFSLNKRALDARPVIRHYEIVADRCFSAKLIQADEIMVTWPRPDPRHYYLADHTGQVERRHQIGEALSGPQVLISVYQESVVDTHRNFGTLLYQLDTSSTGDDASGNYTLRVLVRHDQCFPECVYTCEFGGHRCNGVKIDSARSHFCDNVRSWIPIVVCIVLLALLLICLIVTCCGVCALTNKCPHCKRRTLEAAAKCCPCLKSKLLQYAPVPDADESGNTQGSEGGNRRNENVTAVDSPDGTTSAVDNPDRNSAANHIPTAQAGQGASAVTNNHSSKEEGRIENLQEARAHRTQGAGADPDHVTTNTSGSPTSNKSSRIRPNVLSTHVSGEHRGSKVAPVESKPAQHSSPTKHADGPSMKPEELKVDLPPQHHVRDSPRKHSRSSTDESELRHSHTSEEQKTGNVNPSFLSNVPAGTRTDVPAEMLAGVSTMSPASASPSQSNEIQQMAMTERGDALAQSQDTPDENVAGDNWQLGLNINTQV